MCSDSEKNMSAFADQNHAPSLTCVRLEKKTEQENIYEEMCFQSILFRKTMKVHEIKTYEKIYN